LVAAGEYANPYTDVTVTATFTGPAGEQMRVQGFWDGTQDGEQRFALRFTPPSTGAWSYSVASEPVDAGLSVTGSFVVEEAQSATRGFVRRDPAHPTSFVFDNGERYFMLGNTYYDLIRTACAGDRWQAGIVKSAEYGINKIRIFVHSLGFGQAHIHPDYYPAVFPFVEGDHDQMDAAYWQKMDEVVIFLAEQGMMADLILFMRPYNTADELAFGTQAQDERYARYILARYAAFPNVIWCITNEWEYTGRDGTYWDAMGSLVRAEDPWMSQPTDAGDALRPLSIHNATGGAGGGLFEFFGNGWPVHAIVQYGVRNGHFEQGDAWANYSIVENWGQAMPVVNDEYGYIGEPEPIELTREQHRRALWGVGIGGGYASVGDFRIFTDGAESGYPDGSARVIMTGHWHDAVEYEDVRRYVDFWTGGDLPYWRMEPQNERVVGGANGYLLGEPAASEMAEFVLYAAAGGEVQVTLPAGDYTAMRFDPRTGESTPHTTAPITMRENEPITITFPDANDWVLRLIPR
jgi:hypothetical protein